MSQQHLTNSDTNMGVFIMAPDRDGKSTVMRITKRDESMYAPCEICGRDIRLLSLEEQYDSGIAYGYQSDEILDWRIMFWLCSPSCRETYDQICDQKYIAWRITATLDDAMTEVYGAYKNLCDGGTREPAAP